MKSFVLLALLATGCTAVTQGMPSASYRDTSVAISSSTRFDARKFAGDWTRLAAFGEPYVGADCDTIRFTPQLSGKMTVENCTGLNGVAGEGTQYDVAPYGRLEAYGTASLWVLWVDEDFGTAVIGTPSGAFGWVLNRGEDIRPDRYAAAVELLDFNGYDVRRLKRR